jgi:putative sporulation protein YyaC
MDKVKADYKNPLAYYELALFMKEIINKDTVIICIGTDRCIGDSLGPIVGSILKYKKFPLPVYGTIPEPIHALNLDKKLKEIKGEYKNLNILGIDACLGDEDKIGEIQARNFPIHPGKGVGKNLPSVGNASIIGIVDSSSTDELFTNRNIRLNLILEMAKIISKSIIHSYTIL